MDGQEPRLRKFKISDLEKIMELFVNDKILRNIRSRKKAKEITRKDELKWLKKTIKQYRLKEPEEYNLVITLNRELIGGVGAHKIDLYHRNAEVGYWIGEPFWGKGYATVVLKMFLKELYRKFKLVRISAYPHAYNVASQRVLERNGFELEGIRRKTTKLKGKYINDKAYALVR